MLKLGRYPPQKIQSSHLKGTGRSVYLKGFLTWGWNLILLFKDLLYRGLLVLQRMQLDAISCY